MSWGEGSELRVSWGEGEGVSLSWAKVRVRDRVGARKTEVGVRTEVGNGTKVVWR